MEETNQRVETAISKRDRNALVLGLLLGGISGSLALAAMYAAGYVFIVCSILSPLIVSLVAQHRIMTLSLVPNAVMALVGLIFILIYGSSSLLGRYGQGEMLLGILTILLMGAIPALLVSGLVKLIRRRR